MEVWPCSPGGRWVSVDSQTPSDPQHDFDFLFGDWKIQNRRLTARVCGATEWVEFGGTSRVRPLWDGAAQLDEYQGDAPAGRIDALTLRLYNPVARQWSMNWSNRAVGMLDTPLVGEFKDGIGEFYDQERFEGRSIYVRFLWSGITPTSARWEQAYSDDGGKTWETNWIMAFTRVGGAWTLDASGAGCELRQEIARALSIPALPVRLLRERRSDHAISADDL